MKKVFIAAVLLLSSSAIFAQTKFGFKAGVNFANQEFKSGGLSVNGSPRITFNITGFANIAINKTFFFQPGLAFTDKGLKEKFIDFDELGGYNISGYYKTGLFYLEMPLNTVAKLQAGPGKLLIGAGPYVDVALSGQIKTKATGTDNEGQTVNTTGKKVVEFGSNEGQMKRLDFGLNFLTGYELSNGLSLNAGYGLGLRNLTNSSVGSLKNKVLSISIGFLF